MCTDYKNCKRTRMDLKKTPIKPSSQNPFEPSILIFLSLFFFFFYLLEYTSKYLMLITRSNMRENDFFLNLLFARKELNPVFTNCGVH